MYFTLKAKYIETNVFFILRKLRYNSNSVIISDFRTPFVVINKNLPLFRSRNKSKTKLHGKYLVGLSK